MLSLQVFKHCCRHFWSAHVRSCIKGRTTSLSPFSAEPTEPRCLWFHNNSRRRELPLWLKWKCVSPSHPTRGSGEASWAPQGGPEPRPKTNSMHFICH